MRDEELTAPGVPPIERDADCPAQIWPLANLIADGVARSALTVPSRIPALHDEVRYNAVEREAPIEPPLHERHEVVDHQWRIEYGELNLHGAPVRIDERLRRELRVRERGRLERI